MWVKSPHYRAATATTGSPQLADIPELRCISCTTAACLSPYARPDFPPPSTRINRTTSFVRTGRRSNACTRTATPRQICAGSGPSLCTSIRSRASIRAGAPRAWMRLKRNSYRTGRGAAPTRLPRSALYLAAAVSFHPRVLTAGFVAPCLAATFGRAVAARNQARWVPGHRAQEWPSGEALQPSWQRSNGALPPDRRSSGAAVRRILHRR
jgi:hypothetical protein